MTSGENDSADVTGASTGAPRTYDFTRPNRLSKEQIKRIDYLHTSLAKRLSVSLAGLVRDYVEVSIAEIRETDWSQFIASIPTPCATFTFAAEPLEGAGVINLDLKLAFGLVDKLFGGSGASTEVSRELTPIEQNVNAKAAEVVLRETALAWNTVANLRVSMRAFASNPDFIQASGINESVLTVVLDVKAGTVEGKLLLGYPYLMFEPVFRMLIKPTTFERKREPDTELTTALMRTVPVPVMARLQPSMVSMRHLIALEEGDILMLDNRVSDDVEVVVGDKKVFMGRPGDLNGRLAVKITRLIREGGD